MNFNFKKISGKKVTTRNGCLIKFNAFLRHTSVIGLFILIFYSPIVLAQQILPTIPSFFDPGRVERQLRAQEIPIPERSVPAIQRPEPTVPKVLSEADKITFILKHVYFSGNTVISNGELERIFCSSYNKKITLAELQNKVNEVSNKYRNAGYILSRALLPPQEIKNGIVHIKILEGFISKVKIEGTPGSARWVLKGYGTVILCSRPLQVKVLERQILLANDIPGLSVQAVITPSKDIPASADLTLIAKLKWLDTYLNYDDFGTRFLGPLQTSWGGSLNSVYLPGDNNALHFTVTSQTEELQFLEFVHTQTIGNHGATYSYGINETVTQPQFLLDPLEIIGRSFSTYGNITYPVCRTRTQNLFVRGSFNYQNVTSTILGVPFYQDRIRSLGIGFYFGTDDCWKGINSLDANLSHGFDVLGAHEHFLQSRPKGEPKYTKIVLNAARTQPFCKRFSLFTSLQGQYSFNPLLATEQYGFGGALYGRGYGPSEIVGDRGAGTKVELRLDTAPEKCFLKTVQYFVFYDAGWIWNIDKVNLIPMDSATSTGIGARISFLPQLNGVVYIAKPLTHKAITLTPINQNPYQARGFFQISATF